MSNKTLVVLISGRGSNLEALLEARLPVRYGAVLSNEPAAPGLAIAARHRVPTAVVDHRKFTDRSAFDSALAGEIDRYRPDVVVLAGFMRILTDAFVQRYRNRMVNIHPSLLPAFPGLNTHRRALEAGVRIHGCTVHFVTQELDSGPIIAQAAVPVLPDDTEQRLAQRVLAQEHRIYPQAIRWLCDGRVALGPEGRVLIHEPCHPGDALACPALEARNITNSAVPDRH